MLFNVLFIFLLVSAVLGHRHHEARRSRSLNHVKRSTDAASAVVLNSTSWSGAMWEKDNEAFTFITGTFTVPIPSGANGAAASAWVGINGNSCMGGGLLQTGVDFFVTDRVPVYSAWYEWTPDVGHPFVNVNVSAGDVIRATVNITSPTSGIATIENLTNNQTQSAQLSSTLPLCQLNAEWIVEDFAVAGGDYLPFADFGKVAFTNAVAMGRNKTYTPDGATTIIIEKSDKVLTSVSTDGPSVTITYL